MEQITGLWKKVTGKAAKEARFAEEQRQRDATAEAERDAKANEYQEVISIAIQKPAVALNPDFDANTEVARIAGNVKAIELYGQFHGITIKGRSIVGDTSDRDPGYYGDSNEISRFGGKPSSLGPTGPVTDVVGAVSPLLRDYHNEFGFDFLTAVNLADEHAVLSYLFWNSFEDRSRRLGHNGAIHFLLPKEDAFTMLEIVRKNPDSLKGFIEQGAPGFTETARLRPSDTISIISLDRFDPNLLNKLQETPGIRNRFTQIWQEINDNTNGVRETYHYSKPGPQSAGLK